MGFGFHLSSEVVDVMLRPIVSRKQGRAATYFLWVHDKTMKHHRMHESTVFRLIRCTHDIISFLKKVVCDWQGIALSMMWIFLLEWTVFVSRRENFTESPKGQSQAEWTYNPKLSAQLCWTLKWLRPKAQFYDPECFKNYNTLLESLKKKTILYFTNLKSRCNSLPDSPDFQGTCSALAAKNWRLVAISLSSSFNRCSSSFFCRFFNFSFSATFASKNDARTGVKRRLEASDSIYEHLHCHCHVLWCNINSWKWCSN